MTDITELAQREKLKCGRIARNLALLMEIVVTLFPQQKWPAGMDGIIR